jgi:protein disulfide-isomerase/protein disulfide isomerase family A protein 5
MIGVAIVILMVMCNSSNSNNVENFSGDSGDEKVFRMFHVKWCGHCKDAKPKFIEFMKKNPDVNAELIDAEDDENKDIVKAHEIEGYPTFILTKDGEDKLYDGDRTVKGFEEFIENNY